MGEGGGGCLSLDDALTQETPASHDVLSKELSDYDGDVGAVNLVDQTIDGLLKGLPGQSLIGLTALVSDVLLHHPKLGWRYVGSSSFGGQKVFLLSSGSSPLLLLGILVLGFGCRFGFQSFRLLLDLLRFFLFSSSN